uniref:Uncharacterized protein n=1 Tax=Glossina palpalis gambiensis TaxID=67801 RepID=A0A1B0B2S3_9MUSC
MKSHSNQISLTYFTFYSLGSTACTSCKSGIVRARCNNLAGGRQVEMANDGGAGSVIISKSSAKPVVSKDADTTSVPVHLLHTISETD